VGKEVDGEGENSYVAMDDLEAEDDRE